MTDLIHELGFYAAKKNWPKGLEGMPDLLKRAAASLSATKDKPIETAAGAEDVQLIDNLVEYADWGSMTKSELTSLEWRRSVGVAWKRLRTALVSNLSTGAGTVKPDDHVWVKCPNDHGGVMHAHFDHCVCCSECGSVMIGCEAPLSVSNKTAPAVAVKATPEALEQFTAYFVKNYPGPDTIIFDPKWHAPKIFRAAISALSAQVQEQDLPERFEEWWGGRDSRGDKSLDYNQRKQLAWDAFYAASSSAQLHDGPLVIAPLRWTKNEGAPFWRAEAIGKVYEVRDDEQTAEKKLLCQKDFEASVRSVLVECQELNVLGRWQLVPEDATEEMIAAGLQVDWSNENETAAAHNIWHAMRAAAPSHRASNKG